MCDAVDVDYGTDRESVIAEFLADAGFDYAVGSVHELDGANVHARSHFADALRESRTVPGINAGSALDEYGEFHPSSGGGPCRVGLDDGPCRVGLDDGPCRAGLDDGPCRAGLDDGCRSAEPGGHSAGSVTYVSVRSTVGRSSISDSSRSLMTGSTASAAGPSSISSSR